MGEGRLWERLGIYSSIKLFIAIKFKILIPEVTLLSSSRRVIIEDVRTFLKTMVLSAFSEVINTFRTHVHVQMYTPPISEKS